MPYLMREWAQNIFHCPIYSICQVGKNIRDIWGGIENSKRKLKIIKLPKFHQAKQRAVADYQRETSEENNLILTQLCEELWTLSLYGPQIWGLFQSTFQKYYSLIIFTLPWAQKKDGKRRWERDNSHVLRMGQRIGQTLPGYFIQHSSGYSLQSQKGIKIKPSYLPGIIRSENQ